MTWCCMRDLQFAQTTATFLPFYGAFLNERSVNMGRFKICFHETAYLKTFRRKGNKFAFMRANSAEEAHQFHCTSSKSTAQTRWILWSVGHIAPCGTATLVAPLTETFKRLFIQTFYLNWPKVVEWTHTRTHVRTYVCMYVLRSFTVPFFSQLTRRRKWRHDYPLVFLTRLPLLRKSWLSGSTLAGREQASTLHLTWSESLFLHSLAYPPSSV